MYSDTLIMCSTLCMPQQCTTTHQSNTMAQTPLPLCLSYAAIALAGRHGGHSTLHHPCSICARLLFLASGYNGNPMVVRSPRSGGSLVSKLFLQDEAPNARVLEASERVFGSHLLQARCIGWIRCYSSC